MQSAAGSAVLQLINLVKVVITPGYSQHWVLAASDVYTHEGKIYAPKKRLGLIDDNE